MNTIQIQTVKKRHWPVKKNTANGVEVLQILREWAAMCGTIEHHLSVILSPESAKQRCPKLRRLVIKVHCIRVSIPCTLIVRVCIHSWYIKSLRKAPFHSLRDGESAAGKESYSWLFPASKLWALLQAYVAEFHPAILGRWRHDPPLRKRQVKKIPSLKRNKGKMKTETRKQRKLTF